MRQLVLVFGDQLGHASPALAGLAAPHDAVLMIEAPGEAAHVWSHQARIAIFLSAMRHFRDELRQRGFVVDYVETEAADEAADFAPRLARAIARHRPRRLRAVEAGEWRLREAVRVECERAGVELQWLDDTHFLCSRADFARWAGPGRRSLRMETFYREMRVRHRVLLDERGDPEGGRWNYDSTNRKSWPKAPAARAGPGLIPPPERIDPDSTTREVLALVERRYSDHPGSLASFAWPVCRADALRALDAFITHRLPGFGRYQDAMWEGEPFGWHALLSSSLNLHLLDPREVIAAAEAAYRRGDVALADAEGFIRQILGWREFIRGVYWLDMPGMATANRLDAHRPLPSWYWTGQTQMHCLSVCIGDTLRHGYAHHIQRLMVTGLFAALAAIEPGQVADWYLAVYVDAVEWAELPNVAGMALWAQGNRFTSKPYIASGAYIDRMSNYCGRCRYAPTEAAAAKSGKPLCPLTVLFWDFVERHAGKLAATPRAAFMVDNLERRGAAQREANRAAAGRLLADLESL